MVFLDSLTVIVVDQIQYEYTGFHLKAQFALYSLVILADMSSKTLIEASTAIVNNCLSIYHTLYFFSLSFISKGG